MYGDYCPGFRQKESQRRYHQRREEFWLRLQPREHVPDSHKRAGISCVIAKSFARIFYRNAINIGLPIIEIAQADDINNADELEIDLIKGEIKEYHPEQNL